MPRASSITADLLAEVARRRAEGEAWKAIARDLRQRGLPAERSTWLRAMRADVAQRFGAGQREGETCTAG